MDCLFCKMINGEIPVKKVYEDENMLIINDINPKAPIHMLMFLKKHNRDFGTKQDCQLLAECLHKVSHMQAQLGLTGGYRLVINQGANAGQSVQHLHVHILSGKEMNWEPA